MFDTILTLRSSRLLLATLAISTAAAAESVKLNSTLLPSSVDTAMTPSPTVQSRVRENYGKLPLSFEANHGQTDSQVKFLSRGSGYTLFLTNQEAVFSMRKNDTKKQSSVLRLRVLGANPNATASGVDQLPAFEPCYRRHVKRSSGA